jgi:hypothetical protein
MEDLYNQRVDVLARSSEGSNLILREFVRVVAAGQELGPVIRVLRREREDIRDDGHGVSPASKLRA